MPPPVAKLVLGSLGEQKAVVLPALEVPERLDWLCHSGSVLILLYVLRADILTAELAQVLHSPTAKRRKKESVRMRSGEQ